MNIQIVGSMSVKTLKRITQAENVKIFDDMIPDMISNKKLRPIVTELLIGGRKVNTSTTFIPQSYFQVFHTFFIMKIPNKWELQQIAFNHSSDIDFQDFMNLYKKYIAKPYSFLVIDTILASDNSFRFRKNLSGRI